MLRVSGVRILGTEALKETSMTKTGTLSRHALRQALCSMLFDVAVNLETGTLP